MDKVKAIAERHVQWLVLALALCYVGYNVWQYVVTAPLFVKLPPAKEVRPGDIDDMIVKNQVDPLKAEIDNKTVSAPKVTNVLTEFDDRLHERRTEVVDMKNQWDAPFEMPGFTSGAQPGQAIVKVTTLPELPPANFKAASTRRTVLMAPGRKDTAYWSGRFTIDANALAQAVNKVFGLPGIPPKIFSTEFAQVELFREEQKPDGSWSPPLLIKPLYIMDPYPGDKANLKDQADMAGKFKYQHWMDQHQDLLSRPPFLKTATDAEPWIEPGGNPLASAPTPGAAQPPAADAGAAASPGNRNPAAVEGSSSSAGANPNGAQPNGGFNAVAQSADPAIIVHDITIEEGKIYRYAVRYRLYNPLFNNLVFAVPAIAQTFAIVSPDPLANANQGSKSLAWTGPISVEPSSYVFATKINQLNGTASFDIFEWKDGHWHLTSMPQNRPLGAGDAIRGGQDVSKYMLVDVRRDVRTTEPNFAIVMDSTGALEFHNTRDDAANPLFNKLKAQAVPIAAAR